MTETIKEFFSSLENNKEAIVFGTMSYSTVAVDGLGLVPNDILSRKEQKGVEGTRLIVTFTGSFTGNLGGVVNGRDFLTVIDDHTFSNQHGVVNTSDGQRIALKVLGETDGEGNVCFQLQLRNNGDQYQWVNSKFLFAQGSANPVSLKSEISIYAFDENPFENSFVWKDPDVSMVDYLNFPYSLVDLKEDDDATIIYVGNGHLNTVESFGADVKKVFSGQFQIPEEGLRMNGYFSGPTAGNINGVISGVNYLRVMPDGSMRMNSKIMANTYEGETLFVEALGASFPASGSAWWETSKCYSNLKKYDFLTCLHNIGVGSTDVQTQKIQYNHYGYKEVKFIHQQ